MSMVRWMVCGFYFKERKKNVQLIGLKTVSWLLEKVD